jgi:hypothetical protein
MQQNILGIPMVGGVEIRVLRDNDVECIKLDATPEDQPIYDQRRFEAEWKFHWWERVAD